MRPRGEGTAWGRRTSSVAGVAKEPRRRCKRYPPHSPTKLPCSCSPRPTADTPPRSSYPLHHPHSTRQASVDRQTHRACGRVHATRDNGEKGGRRHDAGGGGWGRRCCGRRRAQTPAWCAHAHARAHVCVLTPPPPPCNANDSVPPIGPSEIRGLARKCHMYTPANLGKVCCLHDFDSHAGYS